MDRKLLEGKDRDELVAIAEKLGVERPRVLTRDELADEILRRSVAPGPERARARGWLGRARDLLASVVEHGLHLPDAARALRTAGSEPPPPPPIATVTLAEIYAAQGHNARAVGILDEVLAREPGHAEAARIREQFLAGRRPPTSTGDGPTAAEPSEASSPPATFDADDRSVEGALPNALPSSAAKGSAQAPLPHAAQAEPEAAVGVDVDDVVALSVGPGELYVYWEVRQRSLQRVKEASPEGALVLRVLAVTPSWDGPSTSSQDVAVTSASGDTLVREVPAGAVVRVSVGWKTAKQPEADFEPLAVGAEVASPKATPATSTSTTVRRWAGPRKPPANVETPLRPIVAAALARARGVTLPPADALAGARPRLGGAVASDVFEQRIAGGAVGALPPTQTVAQRGGLLVVTFERGGASDLIRREHRLPLGEVPFGGASELGGASGF